MKKILLFCLLFITLTTFSQELESVGIRVDVEPFTSTSSNPEVRLTGCGVDTVMYTMAKSTGAQGISINNSTSARAFAQYFDCPQEIMISGAQFVAYKQNSTGGDTIEVVVNLYKASVDSLPYGAPIASDTVKVDINLHGLNLDLLRKRASWTAIAVDFPYVIAVWNNSPNSITMWSSDYQVGDGLGENLGSARIGFNWTRGYNINVGGVPFDADMFIYPVVSYDLDADLYIDPNCVTGVNTITTTNLSSPIMFNRFYSQDAFNGTPGDQCTWVWGDASPNSVGMNPGHTYGGGIYDVTLNDVMTGWYTNCSDSEVLSTCAMPVADFDILDTMCIYDCLTISNNSLRGQIWSWTFNGGTPATYNALVPDSVCWSTPGTYDIQLVVSNQAGSDTLIKTIYIDNCGVGISENQQDGLNIYPNPANSQINLSANENMRTVQLFDMSGKLLISTNFASTNLAAVDVDQLPVGIYVIRILFENGNTANKRVEIIR